MKIKTLLGGMAGIAIALMIGLILIDRLDQSNSRTPPNQTVFLTLLTLTGGVLGGAIASPVHVHVPDCQSERIKK